MAITQVTIATPANEILFTDTSMGNTADAIKASSAKVFYISVDNSANGGAASYVKLFNLAAGSVVVGTTAPDEIIYVPGGAVITHNLSTGANPGKTFGTALSAFCVTTGGTAGSTSPVSSVIVTVNYV
jgi:hypothetical protein